MHPAIEEKGVELTESELLGFERQIGMSLPADYREFLRTNNGGYPIPDAFRFEGANTGSSVQIFFSLSGRHPSSRFRQVLGTYRGRVPRATLPIARDPGGNLLCLQCLGVGTGSVYFWDHEREAEEGEEPTTQNMRCIARSFSGFLDGLFQYPEVVEPR